MPTSSSAIRDVIVVIPFEKIGQGIGICLSIYSYSKIGIVGYRYDQRFANKIKTRRKSILIKK